MDNARDALQFDIMPCPHCGKTFTVDDVERVEDNLFAIKHPCKGKYGVGFYCYGGNLRMAVQNWNELLREYLENAKPH